MTSEDRIIDIFAGPLPGGWDLAAQSLGLRPIGIEIDPAACATRAATGLLTIRADVAQLDPTTFGPVRGLIASPPCQDFSQAGRRGGIEGETGRLMHEVPRWVRALRPRWVACEQVPPSLPWWRTFAREFEAIGYRTWCGDLCAANFGTPQTRVRAFLLASLDRQPAPPVPTHAEHAHAPLFGGALTPWVSMAEALGWDRGGRVRTLDNSEQGGGRLVPYERSTDRPAPTVYAHRTPAWVYRLPSTTVQGDPRIAPPGHHDHTRGPDALRVTLPELGMLQDFRADHPWQGNKTEVARQIGNAVPCRVARAVLEAVAA